MFRRLFRSFIEEVDYLGQTLSWIFKHLGNWRGIKLVSRVMGGYFLGALVAAYQGVIWFFKALGKRRLRKKAVLRGLLVVIILFLFGTGALLLWASTLQIPDLNSFDHRLISQSTQIYDRTGKILLYDLGHEVRRTVVPFDQISPNIKNATVAIEDAQFYQHGGIKPTSILRAIWVNITHLGLNQGGSTITQQVIKNSILTNNKSITRKVKEWILAIKLEQQANKDTILNLYLNLIPYGGNIYGIEEASEAYFGVNANDLTLGESAYLAAMTQAPSYYSPYGAHRDALESRKDLVLSRMLSNNFITQNQYDQARAEKVTFVSQPVNSIKAPHFSMYITQYLYDKYGLDVVDNNGLRVITTLDYSMQAKAEDVVKKYVDANGKNFKADNAALVATDPKNGQILTMVGSRDYFDKTIDGNFNVATAHRQPGSSFKPFVYATAFNKGYTPDTVVFDLDTEFSVNCSPDHVPNFVGAVCYDPQNYEGGYMGPMTFRNALAQSRNIPGVEVLYLAGVKDSLATAHAMGIQSLNESPDHYGLTLVLGGGEVSPLDMTEAFSVFANNGARNPEAAILSVTDRDGNILEQFATTTAEQVLPEQSALEINDILSDNQARAPIFGSHYFGDRRVAMKTGTTNDSRDAWIIGYTPDISVGAWMGNNDNSPMVQKASAVLVAPMWKQFMDAILPNYPDTGFKSPEPVDESNMKPILRGVWQGGSSYTIDITTNKLATELTPPEYRKDIYNYNIHSILYWLNKDDPQGPAPVNPAADPQFEHWEIPVEKWATAQGYSVLGSSTAPTSYDDSHTNQTAPQISIVSPIQNSPYPVDQPITISITNQSVFPLSKVDYFVNGSYIGSSDKSPFGFSFIPQYVSNIQAVNELRAEAYDNVLNKGDAVMNFSVSN